VAAFIDAGGLGGIILMGIDQNYTEKILVGGMLTALLATFFDVLLSHAERALLHRQRTVR
jgi:osmoprotectant transport system permease protein